ncbi:enoyl-CoA hydratase/isomerase family protein [Piscinibacter gummiphilus]|uniref:Enoyl-CoA hydratase/isomerase family protein n=1 Tax=Piscinibacter gummiphilus TaxID=946333 RepID=A0ABZ0D6X2_9BURK|nr:enoyl-CoA hydratase/isomerase family protein [Piscinibacter gummiphilus]WOB10783.1 enoyl-CoA hydratase/isomerase family protein [Piscinibacter gummiphilus]
MSDNAVLAELRGQLGVITLNRPSALNALSLSMIREITAALLRWRDDDDVTAVLLRGAGRDGKAPAFCAGGDIRFFHQAALAGDPTLEDFFTEEYSLNHLIHTYGKPTVVLMDGITMGGGMGLAQGCSLRVVTEHSKLAMPETNIGLFPDVGGGWFLARCPGHLGEYLALTGHALGAADAIGAGLADVFMPSAELPVLVESLTDQPMENGAQALAAVRARARPVGAARLAAQRDAIDRHFAAASTVDIATSLAADRSAWAVDTLKALRQRSPLMLAVTLEQVRRACTMSLADELRMERGLVRHCFHLRPGAASETVEGIRALAVDKDHQPRWQPGAIESVDAAMVEAFFASPWPAHAHPLRDLR